MSGDVTLLTIAAVTGSRNSSGWRGPRDLQEASRLSDASMRMRLRISEVDAVADADKQPGRAAYLESGGIFAQLRSALNFQHVTMPLIIYVSVRCIKDRCVTRVSDLPLEEEPWACAPGSEYREPGNILPTEHVVGRGLIVTDDDLVEIVLP